MLRLLDIPFQALSKTLGAPADEVKLIASFLLSYPLAGVLKRVPDSKPYLKNLFIVSVSLFYLVGLFDLWDGLFTVSASAAGTYAIAKYLRGSPYMPWIGFVFLMGYMSVSHFWRQLADSSSAVDITAAQMVLTMKLSAFCWNVADGQLPIDQLSELQRDRALKEPPPLIDFAGYVFFFPGFMAGPAFDYAEYRRWIDTTMFDIPAEVDPSKKPPVRKKRKIPRSGTPAAWKAAVGLGYIFLFLQLSGLYGPGQLIAPSYMRHGLLHRIWIMYMTGVTARLKYYGVWSLTEGACILAGLGFNGFDPVTGKVSWNRLQNIDPWMVETAQNPRAYLGGWNMNTNSWLRNYVYLRVTPKGKKPGFRASLTTFATSAFWHGFYPGYYLTFILASFIQTAAKHFRRHIRPFFLDPLTGNPLPHKKYYDVATYLVTQLTFSFATMPFLVLTFQGSILAWLRVYMYALIWTVASVILFSLPATKPWLKAQLEKKQGRAAASARLVRSVSTDSLSSGHPILGISKDPEADISEAMEEIKAEIEARQKESKQKEANLRKSKTL